VLTCKKLETGAHLQNYTQLEHVELYDYQKDCSYLDTLKRFSGLKSLSIESASRIDDQYVGKLISLNVPIKKLKAEVVYGEALAMMVQEGVNIESLSVDTLKDTTEEMFKKGGSSKFVEFECSTPIKNYVVNYIIKVCFNCL
jgi:hypothetical protein